jgi:hypothetical protein
MQGAAGAAGRLGDWRADLANVLRSDEPLSPEFREALAKAIEGNLHGFQLVLTAGGSLKKARQDHFDGVLVRLRWMEIGKWMRDRITAGATRNSAKEAAATEFGASSQKCDAALVYFDRVEAWLKSATQSDLGAMMGETSLLALFHSRDASGWPLDRPPNQEPSAVKTK